MEIKAVTIRFHEELNDFLPRHEPGRALSVSFRGRRSIKDLIESLGVPHVEIDSILVNGVAVGPDHPVADQDAIDVHPGFHFTRPPRFVVDDNVAKLGPLLRMLGFDTLYVRGATDSSIATMSRQEERTVVSRDKGLLKRRHLHSGLYIRSTRPQEQLHEVVQRLRIQQFCRPFTRCLSCNGMLAPLPAAEAATRPQVPPGVRSWADEFFQCRGCQKVFWKGSHHQSMERLVRRILSPPLKSEGVQP